MRARGRCGTLSNETRSFEKWVLASWTLADCKADLGKPIKSIDRLSGDAMGKDRARSGRAAA